MKKVLIPLFIVLGLLMVCLVSCVDLSLPVYQRVDSDEDGIAVMVDGVKYVNKPALKWNVHPESKKIAYAGSWGTAVTGAVGDTDKNFLYLCDFGASAFYAPLHRTDRIIPEPSSDSVDEIYYTENDYINSVKDKKIIKEYFETLGSANKTTDVTLIKNYAIRICAYSSEVPGASYLQVLYKSNGKLYIGDVEGFVEMPIDLLEKIAGHKIDLDYILQE